MNLRPLYSPKYFNEYTVITQRQNFSLIILYLITPNIISCSYSIQNKDVTDVNLYLKCISVSRKRLGYTEIETISKMHKDSEFVYMLLMLLCIDSWKHLDELLIDNKTNVAYQLINKELIFKIDMKLKQVNSTTELLKVFKVEPETIESPPQQENSGLAQELLCFLEHLDIEKNILNKSEISVKYSQISNGS